MQSKRRGQISWPITLTLLDPKNDIAMHRAREEQLPSLARLQRFRVARKAWAVGTLNRTLAVVRRILKLSAELWRDEQSGLTWLAVAPMIKLESKYKKRQPYPLGWDEQALLFPELAAHLQRMALFAVNTGARQEEICGLKWRWEQRVPGTRFGTEAGFATRKRGHSATWPGRGCQR